MCTEVSTDGSVRVRSGGERSTQLIDEVRVELIRYNYVCYTRLGSNLEDGILSILSNIPGGSSHEFFYIEPDSPDNLMALFNADRMSDIPRQYRQYTSSINDRWIYFYLDSRGAQPDELIELHYRNPNDWDAVYFSWESSDEMQPIRSTSAASDLFTLTKSRLSTTKAIALPDQISPSTAANILLGRRGSSPIRSFCTITPVRSAEMIQGANMQLVIFDPGHIIDHTARIIRYYSRYLSIIDPRQRFTGLSNSEENIRVKGILVTMINQHKERDSSLSNSLNQGLLTSSFNRFANFGYRKAKFIDNIYNFLTNEIMTSLEEVLVTYRENDIPVDGHNWLTIIAPLAELAGEHNLLVSYFQASADRQTNESAFSTFYKSSLNRNEEEHAIVMEAWNTIMAGSDYAKITLGIAEIRAYYLVNEYTLGRISWREFQETMDDERQNIRRYPPYVRRGTTAVRYLRQVESVYTWTDRLGRTGAILKGDISVGSFTGALEDLAELADLRNVPVLATRFSFIANIIDVLNNLDDLRERIRMDDYDAAFGYGLMIPSGIYAGYGTYQLIQAGAVTGTTFGGPVGAVLGIMAATGAVVVIFATDSDMEVLLQNTTWGTNPYDSSAEPDWAVCRFNEFSASETGLKRQLNSFLNLLHKFEQVRDKYDDNTKVIGIEIEANFLPDSCLFLLKIELNSERSGRCRATLRLRFPSRSRSGYSSYTPSITGNRLIRGVNAKVESEPGKHTLKINIALTENVSEGNVWVTCYPFGHSEFSVPYNKAVYLENCTEPRIFFRSHDFEPDEWRSMPSW